METSGLAEYLLNDMFSGWETNRQALFESKWARNLSAFRQISDGFWKAEESEGWRSDTFIGITKQKILSAWSIIIDSFLQENKFPFKLKPSPIDNIYLEGLPDEERAVIMEDIEDMERLIRQQLKDCNSDRELMKCVMSGAIYGETYAKRYIDEISRRYYKETDYGRFAPVVENVTQPGWEYVSCWAMYRDYETDDLFDCAGLCQVDWTSAYALRQAMMLPADAGYLSNAIKNVISEYSSEKTSKNTESSPHTDEQNPDYQTDWAGTVTKDSSKNLTRYTSIVPRKEFWCRVPREAAEEFESEMYNKDYRSNDTDYDRDGDEVEIMALMAGNKIIRYFRVSKEDRPFFRAPWEISLDSAGGTGVADNLESTQTVLNGMVRLFEDNKKLSANVIIAAKESFLQKMGDTITPGMKIKLSQEIDDARKAFSSIVIPDVGETLLSGIGLFERYADEESQLPKILQGAVHEKQKADTAFEMNQLQTNAGKYLGGVIKNYDSNLNEPIIRSFYEYNMDDPDANVRKRNLSVEAIGFASYQNRVLRLNKLLQLFNLLLSNEYTVKETNIRELIREISVALSIDPSMSLKRLDERRAEDEANAAEVERIRKIEEDKIAADQEKTKAEAELDTARAEKERAEATKKQSDIRVQEAESAANIRAAEKENMKNTQDVGKIRRVV